MTRWPSSSALLGLKICHLVDICHLVGFYQFYHKNIVVSMFCRVPDIFNCETDFMQKCGSLTLSPTPRSPHINLKLFVKIAFCHIYQINLGSSVYRRVPSIFPPKNYFFNRKVARWPSSWTYLRLIFCVRIALPHIYQIDLGSSVFERVPGMFQPKNWYWSIWLSP